MRNCAVKWECVLASSRMAESSSVADSPASEDRLSSFGSGCWRLRWKSGARVGTPAIMWDVW